MKIYRFLSRWNEFISLPLAVAILILSPKIIYMVDPTAAVLDMGIIQLLLFGLVKFLFASGFAWLFLKWSKPELYKALDEYYLWLLANARERAPGDSKVKTLQPDKFKTLSDHLKKCIDHSFYFYALYMAALLYAMTGIA